MRSIHLPLLRTASALLALGCSAPRAAVVAPQHEHGAGTVDFAVDCTPAAQAEFNRAVVLLHHMTYPQARQGFERVSALDPQCALAHWGVAMTLFQPLWPTRPGPAALQQGWAEVQAGEALNPTGRRERLFLATAHAFFQDPSGSDYWERIRRWAAATDSLAAAYPDDTEASAFHALALLATPPSDTAAAANASAAAAILTRLYARHPDHPGVLHYLVHADDVPARAAGSLDVVRQYEEVAPDNPHALHMPTHIYTRLGEWREVIRGNRLAAAAALRFPAGDQGQFVWDEYPHAIEYLVYAELQLGLDDSAATDIERLRSTPHLEPTFKTAFHLASTQARFALERHDWEAAAAIVPRTPDFLDWDRFGWPEAISVFAHGLGAAHLGQLQQASADRARLTLLDASSTRAGEVLFAKNIQLLGLELDAWLLQAAGEHDTSVALLQTAVRLEAATPKHAVTPGPTLPAEELLGDLLLEQGDPGGANAAYRRALVLYPHRFNSLLGAARSAALLGDASGARDYYGELLALAGQGSRTVPVVEARAYLRDHP